MTQAQIRMLKSWMNTFLAAILTALLTLLTTTGEIPLDGKTWLSILVAGLVAILPVVRNYLDPAYERYGRGAEV